MIGSVQLWSQFWLALALLVGMGLWWFETAFTKRNSQVIPYIIVFLMLGLVIGLLQEWPLPQALGEILLERQVEIYRYTSDAVSEGSSSTVPRISLDPEGTWHQVRLLVMALSALLLGCRYFRTHRQLALFLCAMTANGVALSFFGLIQKLTWNGMLFWQIPLTQGGSPFGPFVNRNNAAGYLLICLACSIGLLNLFMANRKNRGPVPIFSKEIPFWRQLSHQILYFVSELTASKLSVLIAIVVISGGIVASLSRGGVLAMIVGAIVTLVFYGIARRPKNLTLILLPLGLSIIVFTSWLGFSDQLLQRFEDIDTVEIANSNARMQTWTDTWPSTFEMGILGSGLGTYQSVHRLYRTDVEEKLYKYAENQYFQTIVEAGWPGLVIYLCAWVTAFSYAFFLIFRAQSPPTVSMGIVGIFLLSSESVASFFDFGFYMPANMLGMSVTVGVLAYFAHSLGNRLKQRSILGFEFPNGVVQVVLIIVFAGLTMACLDLSRKSMIKRITPSRIVNNKTLDLETTDKKIDYLNQLVDFKKSPSVAAFNQLGELWVHRSRLQMLAEIANQPVLRNIDTDANEVALWNLTSLTRIHQELEAMRRYSRMSETTFRNNAFISKNLPNALYWYCESRKQSPLQPEVHLMIGEIKSILYDTDAAANDFERATSLAPANPNIRNQVALFYLQAGKSEQAGPHLKKYLELMPKEFAETMTLLAGRSNQAVAPVDNSLILNEMIPDNPYLLYQFAVEFCEPKSDVSQLALEKADGLLINVSLSNRVDVILKGKVKLKLGDVEDGIGQLELAIRSNPGDYRTRYLLVQTLVDEGMLEKAMENAKILVNVADRKGDYSRIYNEIQQAIEKQKKPKSN